VVGGAIQNTVLMIYSPYYERRFLTSERSIIVAESDEFNSVG